MKNKIILLTLILCLMLAINQFSYAGDIDIPFAGIAPEQQNPSVIIHDSI